MNVRLWLTSMIDVWLGMIDVMLCVLIHVSVCVCVCVSEITILSVPLIELRHKTQ